eukprot:Amastigsp_a3041_38.p2 type:complete len:197 gc:universal Amastigsp_a3041_38:445-1035(+)
MIASSPFPINRASRSPQTLTTRSAEWSIRNASSSPRSSSHSSHPASTAKSAGYGAHRPPNMGSSSMFPSSIVKRTKRRKVSCDAAAARAKISGLLSAILASVIANMTTASGNVASASPAGALGSSPSPSPSQTPVLSRKSTRAVSASPAMGSRSSAPHAESSSRSSKSSLISRRAIIRNATARNKLRSSNRGPPRP